MAGKILAIRFRAILENSLSRHGGQGARRSAGSSALWTDTFWSTNQQWLAFTNAAALATRTPAIFTSISGRVAKTSGPSQGAFSFTKRGNEVYLNYTLGVIPEPSTTLLLTGALTALVIFRRRRA